MKNTLTLFLVALTLVMGSFSLANAQSIATKCGNKYSEDGDKLFEAGFYYQAYLAYEKSLKKSSKDKLFK